MSTLTCRDRTKCSMTSRSSCVNCSGDSSGVEVGVGRAGAGAGETRRAGETGRAGGSGRAGETGCAEGGGGGDKWADGGGGSVDSIRHAACAKSRIVRSPRAVGTNGNSCPPRPSTSLSRLFILTIPSSRSVR